MKENRKSFYEFCIENDKKEWLTLWDYDLNDCSPKDIYYGTSLYYYFKCKKGIHDSELKKIRVYTYDKKHNHEIACSKCNSFEQWCIDNNHQDYLDLWDYGLNDKTPKDISRGTCSKYYFKCENGIHGSELKEINWLTTNKSKNTSLCNQCNSFGQWLLNEYGNNAIIDKWVATSNQKTPFGISKGSNSKIILKCDKGHNYISTPYNTVTGHGCGVCDNKQVLKGYNDLYTTNKDVVKYLCNEEVAFNYTRGSHHKTKCKCPECCYEKYISIKDLVQQGFCCNLCGDGISYPEKIIGNLLTQLGVNFITQLNSKDFDWCENYRYDFYLTDYNSIIETHGLQHYEEGFGISLDERQSIDDKKEELAKRNGVDNYIILDCRYSNLDWIKKSVEGSMLFQITNSAIDDFVWEQCDIYAKESKVSKSWELWEYGFTTREIAEELRIDKSTVLSYLNRGYEIGKCSYNRAEEKIKAGLKGNKVMSKRVRVLKDGEEICVSNSIAELVEKAETLIGCNISRGSVIGAIKNKRVSKGFRFEVVD